MQEAIPVTTPANEPVLHPIDQREDVLWTRLYGSVNQPAVARVLVKNLLDTESATSHRALFLAAAVTVERERRRQQVVISAFDAVSFIPRSIWRLAVAAAALMRDRQQRREMSQLVGGSAEQSSVGALDRDRKVA